MWHHRALPPRPVHARGTAASRSLELFGEKLSVPPDRRTKPRQRPAQILVRDLWHGRGVRAAATGSGAAADRRDARRSGACRIAIRSTARQPRKRFTRSQNHVGEMLDLDRRGSFDPQNQRAGGAPQRQSICARWRGGGRRHRARPLDFDRLAVRGDFATDDFSPTRHQLGRSKTLSRKRLADDLAEKVAQRLGKGAGGLVHNGVLCHPSNNDRSSEDGGATARQAPGGDFIPAVHRLARLV